MEPALSHLATAKSAVLSKTVVLTVPWIVNASQQQMARAFVLTTSNALTWLTVRLMRTVVLEASVLSAAAVAGMFAYQPLVVIQRQD